MEKHRAKTQAAWTTSVGSLIGTTPPGFIASYTNSKYNFWGRDKLQVVSWVLISFFSLLEDFQQPLASWAVLCIKSNLFSLYN
jgi:hypothetical protein